MFGRGFQTHLKAQILSDEGLRSNLWQSRGGCEKVWEPLNCALKSVIIYLSTVSLQEHRTRMCSSEQESNLTFLSATIRSETFPPPVDMLVLQLDPPRRTRSDCNRGTHTHLCTSATEVTSGLRLCVYGWGVYFCSGTLGYVSAWLCNLHFLWLTSQKSTLVGLHTHTRTHTHTLIYRQTWQMLGFHHYELIEKQLPFAHTGQMRETARTSNCLPPYLTRSLYLCPYTLCASAFR